MSSSGAVKARRRRERTSSVAEESGTKKMRLRTIEENWFNTLVYSNICLEEKKLEKNKHLCSRVF